jgi:hypothetical protein
MATTSIQTKHINRPLNITPYLDTILDVAERAKILLLAYGGILLVRSKYPKSLSTLSIKNLNIAMSTTIYA